jgi:hypothetical protein
VGGGGGSCRVCLQTAKRQSFCVQLHKVAIFRKYEVHSHDGQYPNPISVLLYGKLTWQLLNAIRKKP